MLERKKLKSLSPVITESRCYVVFLVRYRRAYVLKNNNKLIYNSCIQEYKDKHCTALDRLISKCKCYLNFYFRL